MNPFWQDAGKIFPWPQTKFADFELPPQIRIEEVIENLAILLVVMENGIFFHLSSFIFILSKGCIFLETIIHLTTI